MEKIMKIGVLGAGTWGYCLAVLLAKKGHTVVCWARDQILVQQLSETREHPHLLGHYAPKNMRFTSDIEEAVLGVDLIVEAVTSAGLRSVFEKVRSFTLPTCPIVITSKGIEQNSGFILPKVLLEIFGDSVRSQITCLSGPSYAEEVIKELPTSVVVAAYHPKLMLTVSDIFTTSRFRVYPNSDLLGVSYGGALKNIIAIACGISDGLDMGYSARAALMTRGLHEMRKLAVADGCRPETLYGLSGMGDLCVTCSSLISRNCRFGYLMAKENLRPEEAQKRIGRVVEGAYTCVSALQLGKQLSMQNGQLSHISLPIATTVHEIIYEGLPLKQAVQKLMERTIKEEHL